MIDTIGKEPCSMKSEREKYLSGVGEGKWLGWGW
mgnify:CR=1 FL=1